MGSINKDCLNTIRLLAALQVVWNHVSWHLSLSGAGTYAISKFLGFFHGIPIFFTLSGFCIWMSIGRSKSFGQYAQKRFYRIYPELWVAVFIEIVALLILFKGIINWPQLGVFAIGQATIFPFWVPDFLREYGCGVPNGALWSIFALMQFYALAYPMYKILHGRSLKRWSVSVGVLVFLSIVFKFQGHYLPINLEKLMAISFVPTFWMFMVGALVAEYKDQLLPVIIRFWYVPVVVRVIAIWVQVPELPTFNYGFLHTLMCFLAALALAYKLPFMNVRADISYGVYIYHMTVVNAMISLGFVGGGVDRYLICVIITSVLAYFSHKTIGIWATKKKMTLIK